MPKEERIEECPYCKFSTGGKAPLHNVKQHIESQHPDQYQQWLSAQQPPTAPQPVADQPPPPPQPVADQPPIPYQPQATPPVTPQVTLQPVEEQPKKAEEQVTRPLPVYKGQLEPDEWLRQFLQQYKFKQTFVDTLAHYVKYRQQLPAAAQLTQDIKEMDSGISNLRHAAMIAEIYETELRQYFSERAQTMAASQRPYRGVPLDQFGQPQPTPQGWGIPNHPPQNYQGYQGIPYQQQPPQQYPQQYPQYPQQYPQPYPQGIPVAPIQQYQKPYQTLEEELERLAKIQTLFNKTEERNPAIERLERENSEVKEALNKMAAMKEQEILNDLQQYRLQLQQETQNRKALEDQIRQTEVNQAQRGRSETDVKFEESRNKFELEKLKLDEGAKTRETIATAIQGGLGSVGQAIARTAQEVGSDKQTQIVGQYDGKHTWQLNCPSCGGMITAPMSARVVTCPSCGGEFEVLPQQPEQSAGFTVEQTQPRPPDPETFVPTHIEPIQQTQPLPPEQIEPKIETNVEIEKYNTEIVPGYPHSTSEPPPPECVDCITQADCLAAGCYWWSDNTCQPEPPERTPTAPETINITPTQPPERKTPTAAEQAGTKPPKKKKETKT